MTTIGAINRIAKEKAGRPDATAYSWERLDMEHDGIDANKVGMGDVPLVQSGPNAGKPNWRKMTNKQIIFVTDAEIDAWYEAHPDVCRRCDGAGEVMHSASAQGVTMKPCPQCVGTVVS